MQERGSFLVGVILIWLSHLAMDFMIGVWPVYKTLISMDLVTAGLIASIGMFLGEGLQLYFGLLSDRGFHQKLLALGIGLTATIPFLSYIEKEWILFIFVLTSFIGSGAFHPAASGLLIGWSPNYKSFLIALFACGGMVGAAISQSVFLALYLRFDGQTGMMALPILLLAACCYLIRFPQVSSSLNKKDFKAILAAVRPYRFELSLLYAVQVCLQIVVLSFSFLLPDLLQVKGYEEWFCLGGGYFYFILGSALTSLPIGYCVHRWGYRHVLAGIIVISAVFLSLFLALESLSLFPAIGLLTLLGGSMGVIVPVVVSGGNSLVPTYASSFVSALYMGGCTCLAGFGPTLTCMIASFFQDNAPIFALQIVSSLMIVALVILYFLPESSVVEDPKGVLEGIN